MINNIPNDLYVLVSHGVIEIEGTISPPRELSIEDIVLAVRNYCNLPEAELFKVTRKREIVQSRQVAMYFSKIMTKDSLANIGAKIGGKDHATVIYACKTVNNLIETDFNFRRQIGEIEKKIKAL